MLGTYWGKIRERTGNGVKNMGTVNPVNKTAYFSVGSVGPTAGGLPHVTHSEHKEQSENTGNTLETYWEL